MAQVFNILEWPRAVKRLVVVALDVLLSLLTMWLAFSLRLDELHRPEAAQWGIYLLAPMLAIPVFIKFGLYRAIFRYTGLAALAATGKAVLVYGLLLVAVLLLFQWSGAEAIPRSLGILQPLIFLIFVGTSRALARFWLDGLGKRQRPGVRRLLIYGAGAAGAQTAAAIGSTGQYAVLGFIDDDPGKAGRSLNGVPVHPPADTPALVARLGITDILLAIPSVSRQRRNQVISGLTALPVHVRTLPGLMDLATGRVTVQDFHDLDIEDLLGREPVTPDAGLLARGLAGRVVLVTGAGGSIGAELCRQIVLQQPRQLLLLDHSEFGLYTVHQELLALCEKNNLATELLPLLGSVVNPTRMADLFARHRPATVYHAAAYKHVPMVEHNPAEGVVNNVAGTLTLARCAIDAGVERFVLISTDKAVRPTNVMGASKRVAEMILQALDAQAPAGAPAAAAPRTRFAMVRFGNVLGSSGSVVPLFRRQIAQGGPLTVTHAEVTRYFMTISEAVQLVLQAGAMSSGGEVFVLDMGVPVRILDLARRMVALSGFTVRDAVHPNGDIEIVVTGLRPGEKLYEELLIGENPLPTQHPRIMQAREEFMPWQQLAPQLDALHRAAQQNDVATLRAVLGELVPGHPLQAAAATQAAPTAHR